MSNGVLDGMQEEFGISEEVCNNVGHTEGVWQRNGRSSSNIGSFVIIIIAGEKNTNASEESSSLANQLVCGGVEGGQHYLVGVSIVGEVGDGKLVEGVLCRGVIVSVKDEVLEDTQECGSGIDIWGVLGVGIIACRVVE